MLRSMQRGRNPTMETIVASRLVHYTQERVRTLSPQDGMLLGELLSQYPPNPPMPSTSPGWYWRMEEPLLEAELEKRGLLTHEEKDYLRARRQLLAGRSDTMPSWDTMDNHRQLFCERLAAYDQRRWYYLKQNIHRAREASGSIEVASPNAAKYERKFNRYIASSGLTGWTYTQETNLKTFPKFRRLPIELRWMIWRYALPGPRLLVVHECYNTDDWGNDPNCSCGVRILFSGLLHSPNPAILSVNRESRAVALKSYHLIFGSETVYADLAGGDILYFYSTEPNDLLQCNILQPPAGCPKCRDLQKGRHILFSSAAIDFYLMNEQQMAGNNSQSPAVATLKQDMGLFPNLKMVWFVGNDIYPMIDHEHGALVAELVEPEPAPIQWANLPPRVMEWWQHSYKTEIASAYMLGQMRKDMEAKNDGKNGKNGKTGDENEDGEIKFGVANVYKLTRRSMRCDQEIRTGFSEEGEELYNGPGDYTTLFRNHFAAPLLRRLRNSSRTSNHDGTPM